MAALYIRPRRQPLDVLSVVAGRPSTFVLQNGQWRVNEPHTGDPATPSFRSMFWNPNPDPRRAQTFVAYAPLLHLWPYDVEELNPQVPIYAQPSDTKYKNVDLMVATRASKAARTAELAVCGEAIGERVLAGMDANMCLVIPPFCRWCDFDGDGACRVPWLRAGEMVVVAVAAADDCYVRSVISVGVAKEHVAAFFGGYRGRDDIDARTFRYVVLPSPDELAELSGPDGLGRSLASRAPSSRAVAPIGVRATSRLNGAPGAIGVALTTWHLRHRSTWVRIFDNFSALVRALGLPCDRIFQNAIRGSIFDGTTHVVCQLRLVVLIDALPNYA